MTKTTTKRTPLGDLADRLVPVHPELAKSLEALIIQALECQPIPANEVPKKYETEGAR